MTANHMRTFLNIYIGSCFLIKFYSNPNLARSIIQDIIDSTHDFLNNVASSVNSSIIFYLKSKSVDQNILKKVQSKLKILKESFKGMETVLLVEKVSNEYIHIKNKQLSEYLDNLNILS